MNEVVVVRARQVVRDPEGRVATVAWRTFRLAPELAEPGRLVRSSTDGIWEVRQVGAG